MGFYIFLAYNKTYMFDKYMLSRTQTLQFPISEDAPFS